MYFYIYLFLCPYVNKVGQSRSSLYAEYTRCPCSQRWFHLSFVLAAMETWMIIYCNAVLSPFLRKNLSNNVTWMSSSLLLETKTRSWKHSERRKRVSRALSASTIQDGVKHGQMCFIHNHSTPSAASCRPARTAGSRSIYISALNWQLIHRLHVQNETEVSHLVHDHLLSTVVQL